MTKQEESHTYAIWIFGILVGLAIKEALERAVPRLIGPSFLGPVPGIPYLQILRLIVFLFLIIRFYLASVYFFDIAHESESSRQAYPRRSYVFDFVFQFFHFLGFLLLAFTIDVYSSPSRLYFYSLGFILIYDVFWFAASFQHDTSRLIFYWMIVNAMNALVSAALYLSILLFTGSFFRAEIVGLIPILVVSLVDLGWMMKKEPFFEPLKRFLIIKEDSALTAPKSELNGTR